MNSRRNVYDDLNAGRLRRGPSALDDLERTLNGLEARVGAIGARPETGQPRHRDDVAERLQQLNQTFPSRQDRYAASPAPYGRDQGAASASSLSRLAGDIERARQEEESFNGLSAVSAEIHRLRNDIKLLTDRPADRSGEILRQDLEELKRNVGMLAREETLRSVGRSWEAFERRPVESDPAFEKLSRRLEDIQSAVDTLPQSLSLQSLEEKVRVLATALDAMSRQNPHASAEHLETIESRLDEISRAIVASSVAGPPMHLDKTPFDRIEARLSSLATRVEEIAEGESSQILADHVASRIANLTERFDELARASTLPEEQVARLAAQIEAISRKMADAPAALNADAVMHGLENRLYEIAGAIDKKSRDATDQTLGYFRDLEGRLTELTQRIEDAERAPAQDSPQLLSLINDRFSDIYQKIDEKQKKAAEPVGAMTRGLESRLDEITRRLDSAPAASPGIDHSIIRNLEAQVQNLSLQLDRPSSATADFDDIAPRLAAIENSISVNRGALLDAARKAAEDALRNVSLSPASDADKSLVSGLANDLKSLEAMARKADDRNSRTFEAIHDTLLKIVDRLSAIEVDGPLAPPAPASSRSEAPSSAAFERSVSLGDGAPALDPAETRLEPRFAEQGKSAPRSPAQAAAAAAAAADEARAASSVDQPAAKNSVFSGLTRAVRGGAKPSGPLAGDPMPGAPLDDPADALHANQPIEPGSGAPDLNSIMKRVREERQTRNEANGGENVVKADLIAAARRAAQAAAAEAEILKKASGKADPVNASGIGSLLNRQRKPILMGMGALIIALSALQFGKVFLNKDEAALELAAPAALEEAAPAAGAAAKSDIAMEAEPGLAGANEAAAPDAVVRVVDGAGSAGDAMLSPAPMDVSKALPMEKPLGAPAMPDSAQDQAANPDGTAPAAASAPETAKPATGMASAMPDAAPASGDLPPADAGPIALREAAASGDSKAFFEIASRYADGRGVTKDMKEAAKYYTKAADAGFAPAQFRVGSFYEKGTGVERDALKAKTWYQMAAEQGNASAMHNLAVLYAMGASGPADNDSAAVWFTKAAELGVKDSQYNLGILAAKGLGVKQNLEDSYKWFALAAKTGDKDASSKRDDIALHMRPEQLQKARAATDLWKAKDVDPATNNVEIPESWKESAGQTASVGAGVDMKKAIRNIQLILAKSGYDVGSPDGLMGGKTKKAIAAFQAANGMKSTGEVDEDLIRSLLAKAK